MESNNKNEENSVKSGNDNAFARQFGQSFATKIVMIFLRLIRNAILARALGPADRGLFSLITSLPELIMSAGNAGISNASAYHTAKDEKNFRTTLGNTNTLLIFMSVILILVSLFLVSQGWLVNEHSESIQAFSYFIAFAIPLMLFKVVNINLLNVLHRISQVNGISLLESLLPLITFLLLWLVFDLSPLMAATLAWFSSLFFLALLSIGQLRQGFPLNFSTSTQKDLLSYGARGHFDTLFQKLLLRIDFIFVSSFLGNEALGYYAMATAAAELLLTLPNSLTIPLFSFFMKRSSDDKDAVTPIVLRVLLFSMVILAIIFAVFGKILILILFGEAYLPAYGPLTLLLPGIVFLSYCSLVRLDFLGRNMPGTVSIISGIAVALNIGLNFLLISDYGINGVAMASTFSYFIAAIGLHITHKRMTGLTLRETLILQKSDIQMLTKMIKR
ncbi:MAG: oligosaccharide flippase family protein [Pseudomonadales bacterium]|nr:oligosaccharide flippase family protein [Pseudomonadales bacterium]